MQGTLTQQLVTVNFCDDTYATIDAEHNLVTVHKGQQVGLDSDWGGQVIAAIELDRFQAIANAMRWPFVQPEAAYAAAWPVEQRVEYIGS